MTEPLKDPRDRTKRPVSIDRSRKDWFRIENSTGDGPAKIYIYDRIGENFWGEGTSAQSFIDQLNEIGNKDIELHLNSPGGDTFDGLTIKNALRQHPSHVEVVVDGLAASAASIVAMGGDHVTMEESAQMMIHNASGLVIGNKKDFREFADFLEKMDKNIAEVYFNRAGGTLEDWTGAMDLESWYNSGEAVQAGLADEARKGKPDKGGTPQSNWDLSVYMYAGRQNAPAPRIFNTSKGSGVTASQNVQTGTQPPTPAAPPTLQPPAVHQPQAQATQPFAFTIDGKATTDSAAVQAYITQLESSNKVLSSFKNETLETGRKNFVENLAKGTSPKIAATQIESLTELALGMTDEQYDKFKASYDSAPANPLFAQHGAQDTGKSTDPGNAEQAKVNDQLAVAREIVQTHRRGGMPEEQLKNTESYQTMVRLEAAAASK